MIEINFGFKIHEGNFLALAVLVLVFKVIISSWLGKPAKRTKPMRVFHIHFLVEQPAGNDFQNDMGEEMAWDFNNRHWGPDDQNDEGVADM
ncbi:unnamed protein product [Caenorhabditis brenneri]